MKTNNCCKPIGANEVKTIAQTVAGAYKGYKKSGVPGAIIGGIKAYQEATRVNSLKRYIIH